LAHWLLADGSLRIPRGRRQPAREDGKEESAALLRHAKLPARPPSRFLGGEVRGARCENPVRPRQADGGAADGSRQLCFDRPPLPKATVGPRCCPDR